MYLLATMRMFSQRRACHEAELLESKKGCISMAPGAEVERASVAYTDAPARVSFLPEGRFMMPPDSSVFLCWNTQRIHMPTSFTPLSIRWVRNGQRFFFLNNSRSVVDDNSYIVLNDGQESASEIDSPSVVQCFTVCFQQDMAACVLRDLITPADSLLESSHAEHGQPVTFLEQTYAHDSFVSPLLRRLEDPCARRHATHGWFEDQFHDLLTQLLQARRNVFREMELFPAVRAATREELYRRLHRARDFMEASLDQPLTIADIAQEAWFSPHHFLRLFKQVFGETPHQYLTRRRLERAQWLLVQTEMPVTDICFAVGFESLGSFSALFRQKVGLSPSAFRAEHAPSRLFLVARMAE